MSGTVDYRRVVTGIDEDGKSCIILDGKMPATSPSTGLAWRTAAVPADNSGTEDIRERSFSFELMHDGGTNFMVAEYPPHSGGELYWHATDTIDYIVVLKGEIVLVLETGEVRAKAGDFIVDRGVIHAWRNDGAEVAASAVVTIPAKPVGKGKTV
ncbi:MAG: cupin domain-containing protein [Novosphingobium sp.]